MLGMTLRRMATEVVWDHYWIGRLARGEIIVMSDEDVAKVAADKKAAALTEKKAEAADSDAMTSKGTRPRSPMWHRCCQRLRRSLPAASTSK